MDQSIAVPRLDKPRMKYRGSVGIVDNRLEYIPAFARGWQLLGQTPQTLRSKSYPVFYRAGDKIRFVPISSLLTEIKQQVEAGTYQVIVKEEI